VSSWSSSHFHPSIPCSLFLIINFGACPDRELWRDLLGWSFLQKCF
jgi:hypothetical protein